MLNNEELTHALMINLEGWDWQTGKTSYCNDFESRWEE